MIKFKKLLAILMCLVMSLGTFTVFAESNANEPQISEEEFKLICDYKTLKGENLRIFNNNKYSYIFVEANTYCQYVSDENDLVEVKIFVKNQIQTAWISAESLTTAMTIIKDSTGSEIKVNELDPEYNTKISGATIISKAGTYNPLTKDGAKAQAVNKLINNSEDYNYEGIQLEDEGNSKDKKTSKDKKDSKTTKTKKETKNKKDKETIKAKTVVPKGKVITAVVNADAGSKLYKANSISSEEVDAMPQASEVKIYNVGVAWSFGTYNGKTGYLPTKDLEFSGADTAKELAVIAGKNGKLTLREKANSKSKKVAVVSNGHVGVILGSDNKFIKIFVNGKEGYVMESFIEKVKVAEDISNSAEIINPKSTSKKIKINLRTTKSKKSYIVDKVSSGSTVTVIEKLDDWYVIETDKCLYAYILNDFIGE